MRIKWDGRGQLLGSLPGISYWLSKMWFLLIRMRIISPSPRDCIRERQRWKLWAWWAYCDHTSAPQWTLGDVGTRKMEDASGQAAGVDPPVYIHMYICICLLHPLRVFMCMWERMINKAVKWNFRKRLSHTHRGGLFSLRTWGIAAVMGRMRIAKLTCLLFGAF